MKVLTPWRPRRELETLQQRMDDMWERLTREFFDPSWRERPRREAAAMFKNGLRFKNAQG